MYWSYITADADADVHNNPSLGLVYRTNASFIPSSSCIRPSFTILSSFCSSFAFRADIHLVECEITVCKGKALDANRLVPVTLFPAEMTCTCLSLDLSQVTVIHSLSTFRSHLHRSWNHAVLLRLLHFADSLHDIDPRHRLFRRHDLDLAAQRRGDNSRNQRGDGFLLLLPSGTQVPVRVHEDILPEALLAEDQSNHSQVHHVLQFCVKTTPHISRNSQSKEPSLVWSCLPCK